MSEKFLNQTGLSRLWAKIRAYHDGDMARLLSGAFAKQTLKVAGPFCAVGFMMCLVLIIISRRKEEKK